MPIFFENSVHKVKSRGRKNFIGIFKYRHMAVYADIGIRRHMPIFKKCR